MIKQIWHWQIKHVNYHNLNHLLKLVDNVKFSDEKRVENQRKNLFCEICTLEKKHKFHSKTKFINRTDVSGERLHVDIFDDDESFSRIEGFRYEIIAMNNVTRMKFFMSLKSKNEITSFMLNIFNLIANQSDSQLKFFKIDNAKEYRGLISTLNVKDIYWKKSISYVQNQDDVAERFIKTMIERTRTLIIKTHLSRSFWFEIIVVVCYLFNRLLTKILIEKISFEI